VKKKATLEQVYQLTRRVADGVLDRDAVQAILEGRYAVLPRQTARNASKASAAVRDEDAPLFELYDPALQLELLASVNASFAECDLAKRLDQLVLPQGADGFLLVPRHLKSFCANGIRAAWARGEQNLALRETAGLIKGRTNFTNPQEISLGLSAYLQVFYGRAESQVGDEILALPINLGWVQEFKGVVDRGLYLDSYAIGTLIGIHWQALSDGQHRTFKCKGDAPCNGDGSPRQVQDGRYFESAWTVEKGSALHDVRISNNEDARLYSLSCFAPYFVLS